MKSEPLFAEIRRRGEIREIPLLYLTIRQFAEGKLNTSNGCVFAESSRLPLDLTRGGRRRGDRGMSAGAAAPAGAGRIYVTDCEGPLTRNDNAQEIAERFVPDGAEFFARLSKYDDFLVDVAAKPGYNAGNTLRLIPPFFKAYSVTDDDVESFSAEQVLLVPEALKTLHTVSALMPAFIISTSYTPYLRALCDLAGFPFEHVRCTELSLDAWEMPEDEAAWLREWVPRVCARPVIEYPAEAMTAAGGHAGGSEAADSGVPGGSPWRSPEPPSSGSATRTGPPSASWTACSGRRCRAAASAGRSRSPCTRSAAARSSPPSRGSSSPRAWTAAA